MGRVAIKVIDKQSIRKGSMVVRVRNEVSIHYQLRHSNVLELLHFFEDALHVYMVMELAASGELYRRLKNGPKLNESQLPRVIAGIVEGLEYLHSHGIIHRDLKLSNILLTEQLVPVIPQVSHSNYVRKLLILGWHEVIMKRPYGKAADLWSLGCLIYTMMVGKPPFESTDIRDTLARASRGRFDFPSAISPEAKDLISKLIVSNPLDRISLEDVKRHPYFYTSTAAARPLCTNRLKPIRQRTRFGILELLADGRLLIQVDGEDAAMQISADGRKIMLISNDRPCREYLYGELPADLARRYEYARKFVTLLRSKTPQLVIVTDRFKAYLMDNSPNCDFQMRLRDGTKIDYSFSTDTVTLRHSDGSSSIVQNARNTAKAGGSLDSQTTWLLSECLSWYRQASEIACRIAPHRASLPFPYIINESSARQPETTAGMEATVPQIPTLIGESLAYMNTKREVPTLTTEQASSLEFMYQTHIPGVGWCLASPTEQFLLLFADGTTLLLDGRKNQVAFHDRRHRQSGDSKWMYIDQNLPALVKEKLGYFPNFVSLLKNGQAHSFVS